jgi:metal-responsive CopG/Arc/MetJ family transcriptional regulator
MRDQVTVRLPQDLSRALKTASRRLERRSSEIVRMALRHYLGVSDARNTRPVGRMRGLIGSLDSGVPDLAEKHRRYVLESLRRGR